MAKKQQQQQQQQNPPQPQGGKGGSTTTGAGGGKSSSCSLSQALNVLFSVAFLAAAALSGYYLHHLLGEVNQIDLRQEAFARQRDELARTLEGAVQKVQSLQSAFGGFELTLKNTQQKQDITEKAVRQGESEINRISEVLQKLQNEILKDLSDGIHVVKDARDRDFTSLENTVEERLTELTKSINDNIAEFTDVQKRSQDEINEVKTKVGSFGDMGNYRHELQVLKSAVDDMQASMKAKEKAIESLQSTIDLMESDVLSEVKELVNLKQEYDKFKEAADTEHLSLQALQEKVLKAEESIDHIPEELKKLNQELQHVKESAKLESYAFTQEKIDNLQKSNEEFQIRFRSLEENIQALKLPSGQGREEVQSVLSKYDSKIGELEESLGLLHGTLDNEVRFLGDTVRSLSDAKVSMYRDIDELRKHVSDLSTNADVLENIQKQVHALLNQEKSPVEMDQAKDHLGELSSVKRSVDELRSSLGQAESDLKMLRTAVDSLVAYSVKIETNEKDVRSVKTSLDDIRNDLDRLFVKVEKIHEKV